MIDRPWIVFLAQKKLDKLVGSNNVCFEWGSGGSTLYFSRRIKNLISIEHDPQWYERVSSELQKRRRTNCDYRLIRPENFNNGTIINNVLGKYKSTDQKLAGKIFYRYCRQITNFPSNYFDIVFVDGRARVSCTALSIDKIKPHGWLVLDNSERVEYKEALVLLKDWRQLDFFGHGPYNKAKWQTSFFQKP